LIESDREVADINEEYAEGKGRTRTARELRRLRNELEDDVSAALDVPGLPR
jgi:hypothetical protein